MQNHTSADSIDEAEAEVGQIIASCSLRAELDLKRVRMAVVTLRKVDDVFPRVRQGDLRVGNWRHDESTIMLQYRWSLIVYLEVGTR